jgi:predicted O-linked N-acetylglucosamine transferase (SPINDLY family)
MNRQQRRASARRAERTGGDSAAAVAGSAITHHQAGRLGDAEADYRRLLALQPDNADVFFNLAVALRQQGRDEEAVAAYRRTLTLRLDYTEAHYNLGNLLLAAGRLDDAVHAYEQALRCKPDHADARRNLSAALLAQATARFNAANALRDEGRNEEAEREYRAALRSDPTMLQARVNLGALLCAMCRTDEGIAEYGQAIALAPDNAEPHYNLGNALHELGRLPKAEQAWRKAIALDPDHAQAHGNLAGMLTMQGRIEEGLATYRRALTLTPDDPELNSNYLLCLHYSENEAPAALFEAHRACGRRFDALAAKHKRVPRSGRLRIGYVSPDLRTHSVAYFFEPLLEAHDRSQFEIACYAEVLRPDATTARLRALSDRWCSTVGMDDIALAERIRADGIDILIDLAGHTAWNRLGVFARKPAPVQMTWLGYPNTTGLAAIDHRIVDAVTDPDGADALACEHLLRLDGGFLCYRGRDDAPLPSVPPCARNGVVTFGSFNNPAKLSPGTLQTWSGLLRRVPQSRLLLKGKAFADRGARARLLDAMVAHGVAAERIEAVGWASDERAHLAAYERVDIALDPFPYNGTTTTCEALWMGVPVVTLRGDRHSGRVGASLLTSAGLEDCIADTRDRYIATAMALANDVDRLCDFRSGLRTRLQASPLCDAGAFARRFERAVQDAWTRWISGD